MPPLELIGLRYCFVVIIRWLLCFLLFVIKVRLAITDTGCRDTYERPQSILTEG